MLRTVLYNYIGTNGTIISPVHLEDTYYIHKVRLSADAGKVLTNGKKFLNTVTVPEDEEQDWIEVDAE